MLKFVPFTNHMSLDGVPDDLKIFWQLLQLADPHFVSLSIFPTDNHKTVALTKLLKIFLLHSFNSLTSFLNLIFQDTD